jgi:enterochelin esterase-like enzyme
MRSSRRASIYTLLFLLLSGCIVVPAAEPPPTTIPLPALTEEPELTNTHPAASSTPVHLTPTPTVTPPPTQIPFPSPTISPTACPSPNGHIQQNQITSFALGRSLDFRIYLPPCYDPQRPGGYPVLYLLHGQGMDDNAWDEFGADEAAAALINSGEAAPFLIVMPREEYYLQDILASRYGEALLEDLIPWVDANFATCQARTCRAIGGLSRGASWAILLGLENQVLFGAAGGHSLPNPVISQYYLHTLMEAMPEAERIRLYLDIGELDRYRIGAEEFRERLEFLQIPHDWHLNEGSHSDEYWAAHVEDYLRWYSAGW